MTESTAVKTKRVAKNTLFLYVRMLLTMAISLYTSRIVLEQLGVNDYGVYNVVGGIVSMFTLVSASMTSAINRFLSFELGKQNESRLADVFSTAVSIQLLLGLGVALLIEAGGVWFLNAKMNISPERMTAANWVLQFSIVTFVVNMISVPYNACIVAHERMTAFAYISVLEVLMKLGVAMLLYVKLLDSLIWYALLLMITSIIIRAVYNRYCSRHFAECRYRFRIDKPVFKSMLGYSGWNFIGSSSAILKDQGVNIALNLFCGTAVNAARGVAQQINGAVYGFSSNFMLAINPQIIKSYASGDKSYMMMLVVQGARLSLYLLMLISLPIILEAPRLLGMWLVDVPEYAIPFSRLILVATMIESVSLPLQFANQATGKIRNYQLIVGGIQMCNFPLAYLFLMWGYTPDCVYFIAIGLSVMALAARMAILRKTVGLPVGLFARKVLLNGLMTGSAALALPLWLYILLPDTWTSFWVVVSVSLVWGGMVFYFIGCNKAEKSKINRGFTTLSNKILSRNA